LTAEHTSREVSVDWPTVGTMKEVVVSVTPTGDAGPVAGTVYLDVRFERLSFFRKLSTTPVGRGIGALLVGVLGAALVVLVRAATRRRRETVEGETEPPRERPETEAGWSSGLRRDFVRGMGAVAIAGLVVAVYQLGGYGRLEVGWAALGVAAAGVVVAE